MPFNIVTSYIMTSTRTHLFILSKSPLNFFSFLMHIWNFVLLSVLEMTLHLTLF